MAKIKKLAKVLTVQVHHEHLNPRTFQVPFQWIYRTSWLAWGLLGASIITSVYATKIYFSERTARPEMIQELENEIQELKIALEKKGVSPVTVSTTPPPQTTDTASIPADPKATDEKPPTAPGQAVEGKTGIWAGLAKNVSLPRPQQDIPIQLQDPRIDWQGKYANFTLNVVYREPGKGSQQGHIVVLGRANDRIFAHPEGVLNTPSDAYLFDAAHGEFFSVARFRVLKTRLGPFENQKQLSEVQVFLFDLNHQLLINQNFPSKPSP